MSKAMKKLQLSAAVAAATCNLFATNVIAQESQAFTLEEVVVTARKKEESMMDVPMSVAVVGGEDISKMNLSNLEDLQTSVPNLSVVTSALSSPRTYIRGQGSDTNFGFEQSWVGLSTASTAAVVSSLRRPCSMCLR